MSAAIDAAARAMYDYENQGRSACPFDDLPKWELDMRREYAQVAVDAAAPHLRPPA